MSTVEKIIKLNFIIYLALSLPARFAIITVWLTYG